jgi:pimeloyl-ACP methyl ester carboxylesterase
VAQAHAFNPRRSLDNLRARLRHALRQRDDGRWTYKFDPAIGSGGLEADFDRLWAQVRTIRCPTLLVRGAESAILARDTAARFTRELPGSTVVEVPGAGHSVMGDNPGGFVSAVRPFLARHGL